MRYSETTYTAPDGTEHPAVEVEWSEVARVLGREHRGTPEDDDAVVAALLTAGAPPWVLGREPGYTDETCWGLYRPEPCREWSQRFRTYSGPPEVGDRHVLEPMVPVTDPDTGEEVGQASAGDAVLAEVVKVGAHWSDQPRGMSGWWVRLREIAHPSEPC